MKRGTTPLLPLKLDITIADVREIIVSLNTSRTETNTPTLQKRYPTVGSYEEGILYIPMSQAETELFAGMFYIEVQINYIDNSVAKTEIVTSYMTDTLFTEDVSNNIFVTGAVIDMTVYDLVIVTNIPSALPVKALTGAKVIFLADWLAIQGEHTIGDSIPTPFVIPQGRTTLDRRLFLDLMNTTSYPYTDFKIYLSTNGIDDVAYVPSSEVITANKRTLRFVVSGNTIDLEISRNKLEIYRATAATVFYLHDKTCMFDDYFRYDYAVEGISAKSWVQIKVDNTSVNAARALTGTLFPKVYAGYVRIETTQLPSTDIDTTYLVIQSDTNQLQAEIKNVHGTAMFYDTSINGVTNNSTNLVTEAQVKAYVDAAIAAL